MLLDFSANDDINSDDRETLSSYEALVRRILLQAHAPVLQVIFPFRWDVEKGKLEGMKRRGAHRQISEAYHTALGDAIQLAQERVAAGQTSIDRLWPLDGVHPGDAGYELFTDAAWSAFEAAVEAKLVCQPPTKMLYDETYLTSRRIRLSSLEPLPRGWHVDKPHVLSAYFDMMMSRWLDDEVVAASPPAKRAKAGQAAEPEPAESAVVEPERLATKFRGSMVMLFGESTTTSAKYRVWLDGKVVEHREGGPKSPARRAIRRRQVGAPLGRQCPSGSGDRHRARSKRHALDRNRTAVRRPGAEIRLESLCVAGGEPAEPPAE